MFIDFTDFNFKYFFLNKKMNEFKVLKKNYYFLMFKLF